MILGGDSEMRLSVLADRETKWFSQLVPAFGLVYSGGRQWVPMWGQSEWSQNRQSEKSRTPQNNQQLETVNESNAIGTKD